MLRKIVFAVSLFICTILNGNAQYNQVYGMLTRCQEYYKAHPGISFDMRYRMFESYTSNKMIQETMGHYTANKENLLIELGTQTQLYNQRYSIVVDKNSSTMVVQARNKQQATQTPLGIDSLVGLFAETVVLRDDGKTVTLAFNKPKAAFYAVERFTVDFEKQTGKVTGAVLYYAFNLQDYYDTYTQKTVPRIEITYENYHDQYGESEALFSEARFITVKDSVIKPAGKYSAFRLIDLRKSKTN